MRKSFRTKVIAVFLVSVLVCMLFLDLMCGVFLKQIFIFDSKNAMTSYAEQIETDMKNGSRNITDILRELNDSYGITASAVDSEANVFFSYRHFIDDEIKGSYKRWMASYLGSVAAGKGEDFFIDSKADDDTVEKLVYVTRTEQGVFIIMSVEIKGIDQDIRVITNLLLAMTVLIAAIGTVVWGYASRPFTTQVEKMSRITGKMAKLNFEEKINYDSPD